LCRWAVLQPSTSSHYSLTAPLPVQNFNVRAHSAAHLHNHSATSSIKEGLRAFNRFQPLEKHWVALDSTKISGTNTPTKDARSIQAALAMAPICYTDIVPHSLNPLTLLHSHPLSTTRMACFAHSTPTSATFSRHDCMMAPWSVYLTCAEPEGCDRRKEEKAKGEGPVEDQRIQTGSAHELSVCHREQRADPGPACMRRCSCVLM